MHSTATQAASHAGTRASRFQRLVLPGFAFKAVVIGGGYATGRELAEFFLPCGPWAGLRAMALSTAIWSGVCALTFWFAWATQSFDYRTFFGRLLGRLWPAFEIAYFALILLVLSVFAAAAGVIGQALCGAPALVGTLCLMIAIAIAVWGGNESVERVFKYVSIFLYGVYAVFLGLCLIRFGPQIQHGFHVLGPPHSSWVMAGVSYAGYNVVCAITILPVARHMSCRRDALIAGALCGPLAILPAVLFFICMSAFYPSIGSVALPADRLLAGLGMPAFRAIFQVMIFAALLESGAGCLNSINQRAARACAERGRPLTHSLRVALSMFVMVIAVFLADRFGVITLIAKGYRGLTVVFLLVYILPLLTYGLWMLAVDSAHRHESL
jgi:uncharacterized membrane protein YkvI